jgi:hypothetical protein
MRNPNANGGDGRKTVLPEATGRRAYASNDYEHTSEAMSYDTVTVEFSPSDDGKHRIIAPKGGGDIGRRLRRYALAYSRYGLPKSKSFAKRWGVRHESLIAAQRVVANAVHAKSFDDDPTIGTTNVAGLAGLINSGSVSPAAFTHALSYAGTAAASALASLLTDETVKSRYEMAVGRISEHYVKVTSTHYHNDVRRYENANKPEHWLRREGLRRYRGLAEAIENRCDDLMRHATPSAKAKPKPSDDPSTDPTQYPARGVPDHGLSDGWWDLFLAKPPLEITHRGLMGRRIIRSAEGKYPRYIERLVTDPERRIFARKTRALGAVVVVDCSGSMAWSDSDLDDVVNLTAGATVLCYSSGDIADEENPNAWIVARNNSRVRHLPEFPGGNGCDGPALAYAVRTLRQGSSHPVIWVSDQRVTGKGDSTSSVLRAETDALVKRYGIRVVEDNKEAKRLLAKLQGRTR